MQKDHPVAVGNRTEARILASLLDYFDIILLPYGSNCRYDMAIDTGDGRIKRIQCKTGRLRNGGITFATCSSMEHRRKGARSAYHDQADWFGVYCPATEGTYLVPVSLVGASTGTLRTEATKNNQASNIKWASDFELKRVVTDAWL